MKPTIESPQTIDAYIADFPADVQSILRAVRHTIRGVVPDAEEAIKYGMPTFVLGGKNLIHFAGYAKHLGVYPVPKGDAAFEGEIAAHQTGKGTARFDLASPIPHDLIRRMVAFRMASPDVGGSWETRHPAKVR